MHITRRECNVMVFNIGNDSEMDLIGYELHNANSESKVGHGDRAGFVRGLLEKSMHITRRECNVMVFNMGNDSEMDLKGYQHFEKLEFFGYTYGVYFFKSGTFVNKGNGGWDNWAFNGDYERSGELGKTVNFKHKECKILEK